MSIDPRQSLFGALCKRWTKERLSLCSIDIPRNPADIGSIQFCMDSATGNFQLCNERQKSRLGSPVYKGTSSGSGSNLHQHFIQIGSDWIRATKLQIPNAGIDSTSEGCTIPAIG